jgi:uncharacterized coiled-coil protein SlyX
VLGFTDISMSESEEQHQQSSDSPTTGYEAAEEERQSLKEEEEERNTSLIGEEESAQESAKQHKRSERRGGKRRTNTTTIATAASAWQVTLIDLDKQLNKQSRLMERMSDDVRHLRKQFSQVQRDLLKFEKRMQKMKTTPSSSKKGKRRS